MFFNFFFFAMRITFAKNVAHYGKNTPKIENELQILGVHYMQEYIAISQAKDNVGVIWKIQLASWVKSRYVNNLYQIKIFKKF